MIPITVEAHLKARYPGFEHHVHAEAMTAQELAAAEHVPGRRVAKPVVFRSDGRMALAVVSAADRLNLSVLEGAVGGPAELVPETEFEPVFEPCERGAEPPLSIFGLPIYADAKLGLEARLVMQAGSHRDSVVVDARSWMDSERVRQVENLGRP